MQFKKERLKLLLRKKKHTGSNVAFDPSMQFIYQFYIIFMRKQKLNRKTQHNQNKTERKQFSRLFYNVNVKIRRFDFFKWFKIPINGVVGVISKTLPQHVGKNLQTVWIVT